MPLDEFLAIKRVTDIVTYPPISRTRDFYPAYLANPLLPRKACNILIF